MAMSLWATGIWVAKPSKAAAEKALKAVPKVVGLGIVTVILLQARVNPDGVLNWAHAEFPVTTGMVGSAGSVSLLNFLKYFFLLLSFLFGVTLFGAFLAIPLSSTPKIAARDFAMWIIPFGGVLMIYVIISIIAAGGADLSVLFRWLVPSVPQG